MPTNLTSTGQTFPTQTAPAAGEARTAASIATPLQNSTDRTQYLKDRLDFIDPTKDGVRRVRRFASIALMKAATTHEHGTVAVVDDVGVYEYDSASDLTEITPVIITPTDVGVGAGRWIVVGVGNGMLNVANGVLRLDANAKVPVSQLDGAVGGKLDGPSIARGIIDQAFLNAPLGSFTVAADAVWRDVTGCQITTSSSVLIGDMISFAFDVRVAPDPGNQAEMRARLVKPDTSTADHAESVFIAIAFEKPFIHTAKHIPASQSGAHTIKIQARGNAGNSGTFNATDFTGRVDVYRA